MWPTLGSRYDRGRLQAAADSFRGWYTDEKTGRLRPMETAPHILGLAPPGTGKTRRWLSQSAVLWPGPAVVSSSKDDLLLGGLSRQRVSQLTARKDFPKALAPLKMGNVWRYEDVAAWARANGRTLHPLSLEAEADAHDRAGSRG